jgi:hypothetical protein
MCGLTNQDVKAGKATPVASSARMKPLQLGSITAWADDWRAGSIGIH